MNQSTLELIEIPSRIVPGPVPTAVLLPPGYDPKGEPMPLCISLHGGGSSRDALVGFQPLHDLWWADGSVAPMVIVTPTTGELSFYFDEPGGAQWETFVAEELPAYMRREYNVREDRDGTLMTGISMGGYGTLKVGFARPRDYVAIAALEPGIEPGFNRDQSPPRSRVYAGDADHPLIGEGADPAQFEANAPAARLRNNADAVRDSGMYIYLECGDHDALNLHDGTEFLHRLLWDLDISHEYHLVKDADHLGPTLLARNLEAFRFLSESLQKAQRAKQPAPELADEAKAWIAWQAAGMQGPPPALDLASEQGPLALRAVFAERHAATTRIDPTMARRYGILPPTRVTDS
jgi:S-formylglutathione hydrolase